MNKLNYKAYSNMLSIQAEICFPFEHGFYKKNGIENVNIIGEIGCGNGNFISRIQNIAQDATFYCYDKDINILKEVVIKTPQIQFICGSVEEINENIDILLLRLVLHQVDNRTKFLSELSNKLKSGSMLLVVDSYDEKFHLSPALSKFISKLGNHRRKFSPGNASRDLSSLMISEVESSGFKMVDTEQYYVPSSLPMYKEYYRDYMLATGEMLGINEIERQEVLDWYANKNAYAQIGLFMYAFIKL